MSVIFILTEPEFRIGTSGSDLCPIGYEHVNDKITCSTRATSELDKTFQWEGCYRDLGEVGCLLVVVVR